MSSAPLYHKEIVVSGLPSTGGSDEANVLRVKVETLHGASQSLRVEFTREADPYFLYELELTENGFYALKNEQKLVVDFRSFPSKFVELLEGCVADNGPPKLHAHFVVMGGAKLSSAGCTPPPPYAPNTTSISRMDEAVFQISETNQFKELIHIALTFRKGNDESVKRHLAQKLYRAKGVQQELEAKIQHLETARENGCEELKVVRHEFSVFRETSSRRLENVKDEMEIAMRQIKEDNMNQLDDIKKKHNDLINSWKARCETSETELTQLRLLKDTLETEKNGLQEQLKTTQNSLMKIQSEVEEVRTDLRIVEGLKTELASKLQTSGSQLKNTEDELTKVKDQLTAAVSSRDRAVNQQKKLESHALQLKEEIEKANDIIPKLQMSIRSLKSEKKILKTDAEQHKRTLTELQESVKNLRQDATKKEDLTEDVNRLSTTLRERERELTHKENLIDDLNKQLTDQFVRKFSSSSHSPTFRSFASAKDFPPPSHFLKPQPLTPSLPSDLTSFLASLTAKPLETTKTTTSQGYLPMTSASFTMPALLPTTTTNNNFTTKESPTFGTRSLLTSFSDLREPSSAPPTVEEAPQPTASGGNRPSTAISSSLFGMNPGPLPRFPSFDSTAGKDDDQEALPSRRAPWASSDPILLRPEGKKENHFESGSDLADEQPVPKPVPL